MVGWYHSGPKLRSSDLEINELMKKYVQNPILVVIDVHPKDGIPTEAYFAVEEIHDVHPCHSMKLWLIFVLGRHSDHQDI